MKIKLPKLYDSYSILINKNDINFLIDKIKDDKIGYKMSDINYIIYGFFKKSEYFYKLMNKNFKFIKNEENT